MCVVQGVMVKDADSKKKVRKLLAQQQAMKMAVDDEPSQVSTCCDNFYLLLPDYKLTPDALPHTTCERESMAHAVICLHCTQGSFHESMRYYKSDLREVTMTTTKRRVVVIDCL